MIDWSQQAMPVLANIPDQADGFLVLKLLGILMGVVGLVFSRSCGGYGPLSRLLYPDACGGEG